MRRLWWQDHAVAGVAAVGFVLATASGAGFGAGTGAAIFATQLDRSAAAPLYDMLAAIAVRLPVGEPGFRIGLLAALLGALLVVGVLRLARALLPGDRLAGPIAVILLVLAPPVRDAAAFADPALLAACGLVWATATVVAHAREPMERRVALAFAWAGVALGAAPWLGLALVLGLALALRRSRLVAPALGVLGVTVLLAWLGAVGPLPLPAPDLGAFVARSGVGAAAIVVGAGLLGAAFGGATGLPHARWLVLAIGVAIAHAIAVDPDPVPALGVLAIGCAIVLGAIARVADKRWRTLVTGLAALPLIGLAGSFGTTLAVDDPGGAPTQAATDVTGDLPAGPGVVIATRAPLWTALSYEMHLAGWRPDLALATPRASTPPPPGAGLVGADVFELPTLAHARARGRGFQLLAEPAPAHRALLPHPARYASAIGSELAIDLALERARYEASESRLGAAARAVGLEARFGAADLAVLDATVPASQRPSLFGLVPRLGTPAGPWQLALFGDDLAWVATIAQPDVSEPPERRLHALWRRLWRGEIAADDPAIGALGPAARDATQTVVRKKNRR